MKFIEKLFRVMIEKGASDLHLSSGTTPKIRLNGEIVSLEEYGILDDKSLLAILFEISPASNKEEFIKTRDTDFAYEVKDFGRFRVNLFTDRVGPGAVFRHIPSKIISAEKLNLPKSVLELCHLKKGLILVTGATGSGKSTTLTAMIDYINRNKSCHIITIEDPIEFVHENKLAMINQREVGVSTKTFKSALRAALREDPDIVLVGEMRDLETIEIAIETAETGHLVFGTLHTTTAYGTVERLINSFPGDKQNQIRNMLSNSLKGVIAQVLLKKADKSGRVAAMEILINTPAIANQMREGKTAAILSAMQTGASLGMKVLNDSLFELVKSGTVTREEALSVAELKTDLEEKLKADLEGKLKAELEDKLKADFDGKLEETGSMVSHFKKPK